MSNPISEFNEELEAFRRLSPRERIEQLTLKLETDEAFVAKLKTRSTRGKNKTTPSESPWTNSY